MQKPKILIVDDEMRIRVLLNDFLSREGYEISEAENGKQAVDMVKATKYNLVVMDVMMPEMDGLQACINIRKFSDVPIMMLTARSEDIDELAGFDMGADDYVTKPFNPITLVARINAKLKRNGDSTSKKFGKIELSHAEHIVRINGEDIELLPKEFTLLEYLIDNHDIVLTREQILNAVWGMDYPGGDRTVDSHMNRLRTKLNEQRGMLQTIRGVGYKLTEE